MNPKPVSRTSFSLARALRILQAEARERADDAQEKHTCGGCSWSCFAGKVGWLVCANPDSPHFCDIIPMDLSCPERNADAVGDY